MCFPYARVKMVERVEVFTPFILVVPSFYPRVLFILLKHLLIVE